AGRRFMSRRLLGPFGGPILFLIVAGLVFAGLGWVTHEALQVEEAQREAALRADREKDLRIALWRLDGRMLPALGVEDTRPFHEYKTYSPDDPITVYGPACAPLLAADLPDWMQLHFQVDPVGSWESPQVLSPATERVLRENWPDLLLRNATKPRTELFAAISTKFPARQAGEFFAFRERMAPGTSPLAPPFSSSTSLSDSVDESPREVQFAAPKLSAPSAVPAPMPPPANADAGLDAFRRKETPAARSGAELQLAQNDQSLKAEKSPEPRPSQAPLRANPQAYGRNNNDQNRSDYENREAVRDSAIRDAQGAGSGKNYIRNSGNQLVQNSVGNTSGLGAGAKQQNPDGKVASKGNSRGFGGFGNAPAPPGAPAAPTTPS